MSGQQNFALNETHRISGRGVRLVAGLILATTATLLSSTVGAFTYRISRLEVIQPPGGASILNPITVKCKWFGFDDGGRVSANDKTGGQIRLSYSINGGPEVNIGTLNDISKYLVLDDTRVGKYTPVTFNPFTKTFTPQQPGRYVIRCSITPDKRPGAGSNTSDVAVIVKPLPFSRSTAPMASQPYTIQRPGEYNRKPGVHARTGNASPRLAVLKPAAPDLYITQAALILVKDCRVGSPVAHLQAQVANKGNAPFPRVNKWMLQMVDVSGRNEVVSGVGYLPEILPGGFANLKVPLKYVAPPRNQLAGLHHIMIRVNPNNDPKELDQSNNTIYRSLSVPKGYCAPAARPSPSARPLSAGRNSGAAIRALNPQPDPP